MLFDGASEMISAELFLQPDVPPHFFQRLKLWPLVMSVRTRLYSLW